jgi:hypothetical protein
MQHHILGYYEYDRERCGGLPCPGPYDRQLNNRCTRELNSMQSRSSLRLVMAGGSSRYIGTAAWPTHLHCLQEQQVAGLLAHAAAAAAHSAAYSGIQAGRHLAAQTAAALLAPA